MATFKVSPAHDKFIRTFAKRRVLDATEGLAKILDIAQSRVKALDNYAKAGSGSKKSRKTAKKAARKAAAKSTRKAAAKSPARKARKASASKKSTGVPKGFHTKPNSTPEPETTAPVAPST